MTNAPVDPAVLPLRLVNSAARLFELLADERTPSNVLALREHISRFVTLLALVHEQAARIVPPNRR